MIKLPAKKEESVGLDVGKYSVKVIAIEGRSGDKTLTAYNIKRVPPDLEEGKSQQCIKEALEEIDLHPERVNLSISGPDVIVRFINLPRMSREQLKSALVFEAEKYIPFNINEVILDFIILGDAPETGQMRVLLAAAKREPVEKLVRTVEALNINVNIMDTDPFAMFNTFIEASPPLEDEGNAFLDLGHSQTDVLISIDGTPCFMRQIQIGGRDIANAICQNLSVSPEKAEELKKGIGQPDNEAVNKAAESVLDDIIKEMQLSFGYFENRYNKGINGIYCSGGMVYQKGVIEYLGGKLGIDAKKWDPLKGLKISENLSKEDINSVASQLAVSIGLALRG